MEKGNANLEKKLEAMEKGNANLEKGNANLDTENHSLAGLGHRNIEKQHVVFFCFLEIIIQV